jgi:hypothetical protein
VKKLLNLKQWLTVAEAARHLSILFAEEVSEADVLQLALDAHLTLSVHFINGARGRCGPIVAVADAKGAVRAETPDEFKPQISSFLGTDPEGFWHSFDGLLLDDGRVLDYGRETILIDGVWDLSMLGHERLEIEQRYQILTAGPEVDTSFRDGQLDTPIVSREDGTFCQIHEPYFVAEHYFPAEGLPADGVLVVRTSALHDLEARLSEPDQTAEKPLKQRERTTLLVIIAALAELPKIDVSKPSKAAAAIESQTMLMGARVSARRIEDHLKRIPAALEDRNK